MKIQPQKPLFAWGCLDDNPTLATLKQLLETIPDGKLLESLHTARGKGRDDFPVSVLWGVIVLTIALRHTGFEACLGELGRNPSLAKLIGIHSPDDVPKGWNVSRFLHVLGQEPHRLELEGVFNQMLGRLGEVVPDLGRDTAGDSTALQARRLRRDRPRDPQGVPASGEAAGSAAVAGSTTGVSGIRVAAPAARSRAQGGGVGRSGAAEEKASEGKSAVAAAEKESPQEKITYDEHGLPQPSGGRKEYRDEKGVVVQVYQWFGYKLHLLVDVKHEVVLAYRISSTKAGDNEELPPLLDEALANLPKRRIHTLAYDKAADDVKVHEKLHACGIKPVIQNRALWKEEQEKLLPGHDGNSNIVYDEAGTLYCYDRVSQPMIRRPMAYIGHEPARGTLKYRCPAKHDGLPCAMSEICNAGKRYGLTVRVKQEIDLRRFPPLPRATKKFERLYKGRTSVERVNARLKIFWGADDGNVTGAPRFHAMVGTVLVVHAAFATLLAAAPRHEGTLGKMRLGPIAKALYERITGREGKGRPQGKHRNGRRASGKRGGAKQCRLFAA
jgi:hypothetical protein